MGDKVLQKQRVSREKSKKGKTKVVSEVVKRGNRETGERKKRWVKGDRIKLEKEKNRLLLSKKNKER